MLLHLRALTGVHSDFATAASSGLTSFRRTHAHRFMLYNTQLLVCLRRIQEVCHQAESLPANKKEPECTQRPSTPADRFRSSRPHLASAVTCQKPKPRMNKPSKSEEYCTEQDASLALVIVETRERGRARIWGKVATMTEPCP